jgi:hypothetical protein
LKSTERKSILEGLKSREGVASYVVWGSRVSPRVGLIEILNKEPNNGLYWIGLGSFWERKE